MIEEVFKEYNSNYEFADLDSSVSIHDFFDAEIIEQTKTHIQTEIRKTQFRFTNDIVEIKKQ